MESNSFLGPALSPVYDTLSMAQTVLTVMAVLLLAIIGGIIYFVIKMSKKK